MVSFHSMCAVQAVMSGIPSYCSEHSPAYPVSLGLDELDQINSGTYLITSAIHTFEFGREGGDEHYTDLEVRKDTIF